jgi:SAM-dependent methyltransferase
MVVLCIGVLGGVHGPESPSFATGGEPGGSSDREPRTTKFDLAGLAQQTPRQAEEHADSTPLRDSLAMASSSDRWNHTIHYHSVILGAIPPGCRRALDVGCGEGTLTRELRRLVPEVVGIDSNHGSISAARAHPDAGDIQYLQCDALAFEFEPASFDLVTAVASLHHMQAERALVSLRSLLRPGGVLAVIGLAGSSPSDWPLDIAAIVPNRLRRLRSQYWHHPSPVVRPPPESCASMRRITTRVLPGARFQRRLYWRYTLVWLKP